MNTVVPPDIAAVIPAYNRADTIGRAIESVVSQQPRPAEIVVVDDGSTDATADIAASFGPTVRVETIDNSGPAVARNIGERRNRDPGSHGRGRCRQTIESAIERNGADDFIA